MENKNFIIISIITAYIIGLILGLVNPIENDDRTKASYLKGFDDGLDYQAGYLSSSGTLKSPVPILKSGESSYNSNVSSFEIGRNQGFSAEEKEYKWYNSYNHKCTPLQ